ncbi:hypothetical protein ACKKBG_A24140 [Auxenochlorella protothecoides x Auxenochlorella symbiontica]
MQDVQVEGGFLGSSLGGPLTESRSINVVPPPASEKLHRLKSLSLGRERASPNSGDRDESPTAGSGPAASVLPKDLQVLSAELAHPASTDILAVIGTLQKSGPADARTSRSALLRAGACYLAHDAESTVSAHAGQARKLARARLHLAFHEANARDEPHALRTPRPPPRAWLTGPAPIDASKHRASLAVRALVASTHDKCVPLPKAVRPPPDLSRAQAETLRPLLARLRLQLALQAWRQALRRLRLQAAVAARCAHGADAGRVRTALLGWREMALPSAEALAAAARVEAQRKEAARRASLRAWAEAARLSRRWASCSVQISASVGSHRLRSAWAHWRAFALSRRVLRLQALLAATWHRRRGAVAALEAWRQVASRRAAARKALLCGEGGRGVEAAAGVAAVGPGAAEPEQREDSRAGSRHGALRPLARLVREARAAEAALWASDLATRLRYHAGGEEWAGGASSPGSALPDENLRDADEDRVTCQSSEYGLLKASTSGSGIYASPHGPLLGAGAAQPAEDVGASALPSLAGCAVRYRQRRLLAKVLRALRCHADEARRLHDAARHHARTTLSRRALRLWREEHARCASLAASGRQRRAARTLRAVLLGWRAEAGRARSLRNTAAAVEAASVRWREAHLLRRWRAQAELALRARALERSTLTRRTRRAFRAWRTEASVRLTLATLHDELECRTRGRLLRACLARWRAAAARAGLLRRVFGAALAARSRPEGAERIALDYNTLASCFLAWQAGLARARARRMEVAARYAADAFRRRSLLAATLLHWRRLIYG